MENKKYNMPKQHKKNFGFTLFELIIVIGMVAILASVAVPSFISWRTNMYLKAAARDLYSSIQEARLIAIKKNIETAIVFDTTNNCYYLCDDSGTDGAWDGTNDNIGTGDNNIVRTNHLNKVRYGHGNVPAGNSATTIPGVFPADNISYSDINNVIRINSRGIAREAGYVYLENQAANRSYAVGTQTSGLVRILKWNGGSWQ